MGAPTNQSDGRKVIIYTFAYNASKTIHRTIESTLKQSYTNWIWYLVDNGSTDDTGMIIRDYARRDTRIVPLANKQNHVWELGNRWWEVIWNHSDNDFLCCLDADDEYKPEFLEKMLAFADANKLEIAACGNDFIDARTSKTTSQRVLNKDLIIEGPQFSEYLVHYHQFMRTMWGKLYAIVVVKKFNWENAPDLVYGWDTLFVTENFRNASRVGILAESLHKYYVSSKSLSYHWDEKRLDSDRILNETVRKFLNDKCGGVTPCNADFLLCVYMYAVKDTLNVLMNAKITIVEKISGVIDIFTAKQTKRLMAQKNFGSSVGSVAAGAGKRQELFSAVAAWLLALSEVPDELVEGYCNAGELLCAAVENAGGWLCFKKLRVRFLIEQKKEGEAKDKLAELIELIPNDPEIIAFQQSI